MQNGRAKGKQRGAINHGIFFPVGLKNLSYFDEFDRAFARVLDKKMCLAVLWICDRVFDADSGNGIHVS